MHINRRNYYIYICLFIFILFAKAEKVTNSIVIIKQQSFSISSCKKITIGSLNGNKINTNQLPSNALKQLIRLQKSIISHLELEGAYPQDIVRIIVEKPKPTHLIQLGSFINPQDQEPDPAWLEDLTLGNKKIQCIATNVSLLNLSFVFADTFNCEFGITTNGEAMFRNKNAEAKVKHPFYLIKPVKKSAAIITKEIKQKGDQQNSIIVFIVCSVFLLIAALTALFFRLCKK